MTEKIKRDIAVIAGELQTVMKREATDIIAIGDLLLEARGAIGNGDWRAWLAVNFGSSSRTADNYMDAARLAERMCNVSQLKLRPTALYLLGGELDNPDGLFNSKAVAAILKAAETELVNADRAREIAVSLLPPPPKPEAKTFKELEAERAALEAERAKAEKAAQEEAEKLLDGPPPELPPPPQVKAPDVIGPSFDTALATLATLRTKPLAAFAGTSHPRDTIKSIGTFLREVAGVPDEPAKAAPDPQLAELTAENARLKEANALLSDRHQSHTKCRRRTRIARQRD